MVDGVCDVSSCAEGRGRGGEGCGCFLVRGGYGELLLTTYDFCNLGILSEVEGDGMGVVSVWVVGVRGDGDGWWFLVWWGKLRGVEVAGECLEVIRV